MKFYPIINNIIFLITHPRQIIAEILDYLNLPWHDNVLRHHELHQGSSIGKTINNKAIDSSNINKWKEGLETTSLQIINRVCGELAEQYGYDLS